jgi:two-component system sensor histidine kinase KdpD
MARTSRGRLKVFLGYAAGVGKTFRMLDEAQRLLAQGHDLVVGYFEPHGRRDTIAKLQGLEVVPRRRIEQRPHSRRWTRTRSWPASRRSARSTS